jgi:hypothetical protein
MYRTIFGYGISFFVVCAAIFGGQVLSVYSAPYGVSTYSCTSYTNGCINSDTITASQLTSTAALICPSTAVVESTISCTGTFPTNIRINSSLALGFVGQNSSACVFSGQSFTCSSIQVGQTLGNQPIQASIQGSPFANTTTSVTIVQSTTTTSNSSPKPTVTPVSTTPVLTQQKPQKNTQTLPNTSSLTIANNEQTSQLTLEKPLESTPKPVESSPANDINLTVDARSKFANTVTTQPSYVYFLILVGIIALATSGALWWVFVLRKKKNPA